MQRSTPGATRAQGAVGGARRPRSTPAPRACCRIGGPAGARRLRRLLARPPRSRRVLLRARRPPCQGPIVPCRRCWTTCSPWIPARRGTSAAPRSLGCNAACPLTEPVTVRRPKARPQLLQMAHHRRRPTHCHHANSKTRMPVTGLYRRLPRCDPLTVFSKSRPFMGTHAAGWNAAQRWIESPSNLQSFRLVATWCRGLPIQNHGIGLLRSQIS